MASMEFKNNVNSTVADNPLAAGATTLNVATGEGANFPSSFPFLLTIWDAVAYPNPGDDPGMEIDRCTARATDALTIVRGQEGTGDVAHALGEKVAMLITAGHFDNASYGIVAKLDTVAVNANNYSHPNHTGEVTSAGDGAQTIAASAVVTAKINTSAVTTAKIAAANITATLIGTSAVTSAKIAESAVTAAKIAALAVGSSEIAACAVITAKINDSAVTTAKIAAANITATLIGTSAVTSAKIAESAVTASKIASGTIKANIWLPAESAYLPATNPAELSETLGATEYGGYSDLGFDDSQDEHAIWRVPVPDYDGGNIIFKFYWFATAISGDVAWNIESIGVTDGEEILEVVVADAVAVTPDTVTGTTLDLNVTTYSTYNPAGTAAGDIMVIEITRDISRDDMLGDARLVGILLEYFRG